MVVHEKPRRLSILGIDDQEVIRELLTSLISRMGHRIVIASEGRSGLKLFEEGHYDLVIAEADLPGISGWNIAQKVKEISSGTPVIILSGWGLEAEEGSTLRSNADFVITKPFKMEQLGKVIGAACEMITG